MESFALLNNIFFIDYCNKDVCTFLVSCKLLCVCVWKEASRIETAIFVYEYRTMQLGGFPATQSPCAQSAPEGKSRP